MLDLFTLGSITTKIIGEASAFSLCSIGASVLGNRADAFAMDTYERIRARIDSAPQSDPLVNNHHLARGTLRAALLATNSCIDRLLARDDAAEALNDRFEWATGSLRKQLARLIRHLESEQARGGRAVNRRRFEAALKDGASLLHAPNLDQAGKAMIGLQNTVVDKAVTGATARCSFRQARERLLPGIDTAVVAKVVEWGGWRSPHQPQVGKALHAALFGDDEHWINDFGHFYAAELRQDTNLWRVAALVQDERVNDSLADIKGQLDDAEALWQRALTSYEGLPERIDRLSSELARVIDALESANAGFELNGNSVFMGLSATRESHRSDYSSFYFAKEEDEFVGRADVLNDIKERLLDDPRDFAWMAVCGDAALGKSRLAFQLLKENEATWRLSGFVRSAVIRNADAVLSGGHTLSEPTIFVLDYAGNNPEKCAEFIGLCAAMASGAHFPIRVIVLVRRPSDQFFSYAANDDGFAASDSQVLFDYDDNRNLGTGALVLSALSDEETLALMRARMKQTATSLGSNGATVAVRSATNDELRGQLIYYDQKRRPLFAAMVADAFQRDVLARDHRKENQEEARLRLFWEYLERQYVRRWQRAGGARPTDKDAQRRIDRHLSFAILSTMCRGLTDSGWQRLRDHMTLCEVSQKLLPVHPNDFGTDDDYLEERTVLASIVGDRRSSKDEPYPILEPDLIGESLVLLALSDQDAAAERISPGNSAVARQRRNYLRDLAWAAEPDGAAFFAGLVAEDFPDHAKATGWLLPKNPSKDDSIARAQLLRNLSSVAIDNFRGRAANISDLARIEDLIARFDFNDEAPAEAIGHLAEALNGLNSHVSFIINKSEPPADGIKKSPIQDPKDAERKVFDSISGSSLADALNAASAQDRAGEFDIAAIMAERDDGTRVFSYKSDANTVERAMELLRRSLALVWAKLFSDIDVETRFVLLDAVSRSITSVYSDTRDDEKHFGFANSPISDDEKATRQQYAQELEDRLLGATPDEATVALVAKAIAHIVHAESGSDLERTARVYAVVRRFIESGTIESPTTIYSLTYFLSQHLILAGNSSADDSAVYRTVVDEIVELTQRLIGSALQLPSIGRKELSLVLSGNAGIARRASDAYRRLERPFTAVLDQAMENYVRVSTELGPSVVRNSVLDLFAHRMGDVDASEAAIDERLQALLQNAQEAGFDSPNLHWQTWRNLGSVIRVFVQQSSELWPTVQKILERLTRDVGKRARDELLQNLRDHFLPGNTDLNRTTFLTDLADPIGCQEPGVRLHLFAKRMAAGDDDWCVDVMERWWGSPDLADDARPRILAFRQLGLYVRWWGVEHPNVRRFRDDVLTIIHNKHAVTHGPDRKLRHAHDAALSDVAADYARLEIAAGHPPDDWVRLLE